MGVAKRTHNTKSNGCGLVTLDDCIQGAKLWNRMPFEEKETYRQMDDPMEGCEQYEPEASSSRSNETCFSLLKRKKRCRVQRKKWTKPGPITTNPYLNYVRTIRRKYCGLLPNQLVSLAAYHWRHLSDNQKLRYRLQASKEKAKKRLNRRKACEPPPGSRQPIYLYHLLVCPSYYY